MRSDNCVFCKIVAEEIPADVLVSTDAAVAFRDLNPQAPTHVLVVPRNHHNDVAATAAAEPATLAQLVEIAARVASGDGLDSYRLVFNTGEDAGQSVFHTHLHVLGGRPMSWPPG